LKKGEKAKSPKKKQRRMPMKEEATTSLL